jgi:CYTH domain-containing protein
MEIEKKFLLKSPSDVPGAPERQSRIEQFYLDPIRCRAEKRSDRYELVVENCRVPLEGAAAPLIPTPFPAFAVIRLRRHAPLHPGKPPIVLCFKWAPSPEAGAVSSPARPESAQGERSGGRAEIKSRPSAVVSEEYEFPLFDLSLWDSLSPAILGRPILKTRRYFESLIPGRLVELDVFEGALAGLVVAEVEFPDLAQVALFEAALPPFLSRARDVSADRRYSNRVLALDGMPAAAH